MNLKVPASLAFLALLAFFIYQAVAPVQAPQSNAEAPVSSNSSAELPPAGEPTDPAVLTAAPNFDRRRYEQEAKQAVQSATIDYQAIDTSPQAMAERERQMQDVIAKYNEVLDDPEAKAAYQKQFKALSDDYKKAVLAKLKKDQQ